MGKINFDESWRFYNGNLKPDSPCDGWSGAKAKGADFAATKMELDDSKWRLINLPHDFVVEGDYTKNKGDADMQAIPEMESIDSRHFAGGSLSGGIAWYRKKFEINEKLDGKRVLLHFDGIYRNSTVYLNHYYIGSHSSGYTGFYFDITDFLNIGDENILAVRVDASEREGWWYEGGGIYRHVWLEITDEIHFEPNSVYICPTVISKEKTAVVKVSCIIYNSSDKTETVTIKSFLKNLEGEIVSGTELEIETEAFEKTKAELSYGLSDVNLWDIETPYLYKAVTEIYKNNSLADYEEHNIGMREIEFDANKGFILNGRAIKLKGVCCHHDHAGVGIGIPDSVNEYRISQIKSMGANAFRSAHYEANQSILDACDKLGILVFDETRRMTSSREDLECLRDTIKTGRNHPSVVLWGIGNEEIFAQHRPEAKRMMHTMINQVHKLDSTRAITTAVVCWDGVRRYENAHMFFGITDELDVMGFNYCEEAWDDYHKHNPKQPVIVTEQSGITSTRGCYETDEPAGRYFYFDEDNEKKCKAGKKANNKNKGQNAWKSVAERDYIAGLFIWTGIDYRGEPTPMAYPSVYSHFGAMDYCAFPKDAYYYYKSCWQEKDVLHIFPHWNLQDKIGKKITVFCYGNCDEAELFVNGKSYGRKNMEKNWYLRWDEVTYDIGEAKVIGYKNGEEVKQDSVKTTDAAYSIMAKAYKSEVNKGDTAIINIDVIDKNGIIVPNADNLLRFEVENGEFLGCGNGNPADHDSDKIAQRRAFMGKAQLLISCIKSGEVKIKIYSQGLKTGECVVKTR